MTQFRIIVTFSFNIAGGVFRNQNILCHENFICSVGSQGRKSFRQKIATFFQNKSSNSSYICQFSTFWVLMVLKLLKY